MKLIPVALYLGIAAGALAQDSKAVAPQWKPTVGSETSYAVELKFQAMGQDAVFTGTAKSTTVKVNPDGSYELEGWMDGGKVSIMGSEQEQPDEHTVTKYDKDGMPLEKREFGSSVEEMLSVFTHVSTPTAGAKAGDKWKLTDKFDRIGKGEAEYIGTEDFQGKKCLAFKVTYEPKDGGTCEGKAFVKADDGHFAGFDMSFKKVQVAPGIESDGTASMKLLVS